VAKYGGCGVGTDGKGSSIRAEAVVAVDGDEVHMLNEWWVAPPRRDGQTIAVGNLQAKRVRVRRKVSKTQYAYPIREAIIMIIELIRHRSR